MATDFTTGTLWQSSIPNWQRIYYEGLLMETLRTKSIMVPYTIVKEDFTAKKTGIMQFTEVYDTEPNWNTISETDLWLSGAHLDSRSQTISLEVHGDILKFSDYSEITTYINNGDIRGLVREKIGQNLTDTLDILARNAFLAHPYPFYAGGAKTSRATIAPTDLFDPDLAELARTHLEEHEIPGVVAVDDSGVQTIVCVTTPRVIHDIRTAAGSNWLELQQYAGGGRKFNGEVGTWNGVRFVRTNRLVLRNYGEVSEQTSLAVASQKGEGAAATVDTIYSVGRDPNAKRYITVAANAGLVVGDYITIHSAEAGTPGEAPNEADGTQETRRIVGLSGVGNVNISLDKPLMKPHAQGDFVTKGRTLHASLFMGGPSVVFGIAERPTPILPPKFDDLMMINRIGWRGMFKFQQFRPEYYELHLTAGTTN
ncbi:MAG: N4-gp56 family major capsid protein [Anaerolineales bacterium]|nr:N4-gp56 family major capsid protein [Anaerolineales bacterium]